MNKQMLKSRDFAALRKTKPAKSATAATEPKGAKPAPFTPEFAASVYASRRTEPAKGVQQSR